MNRDISITSNIGSFSSLTNLGVKNGFTFSQEVWGSMRILSDKPGAKYTQLMSELGMTTERGMHLNVDHNDAIQTLTKDNIEIYERTNQLEQVTEFTAISFDADGITTKESIPIVVTPADCAIVCITGVDIVDKKRFIGVFHAGIFGVHLQIQRKMMRILHFEYDFVNEDLEVFVFPTISAEHFVKSKDDTRAELRHTEYWKDYIREVENGFQFDIKNRLINDLEAFDLKVTDSELDTYTEAEKGTLYSHVYNQEHKLETTRFAVALSL